MEYLLDYMRLWGYFLIGAIFTFVSVMLGIIVLIPLYRIMNDKIEKELGDKK